MSTRSRSPSHQCDFMNVVTFSRQHSRTLVTEVAASDSTAGMVISSVARMLLVTSGAAVHIERKLRSSWRGSRLRCPTVVRCGSGSYSSSTGEAGLYSTSSAVGGLTNQAGMKCKQEGRRDGKVQLLGFLPYQRPSVEKWGRDCQPSSR